MRIITVLMLIASVYACSQSKAVQEEADEETSAGFDAYDDWGPQPSPDGSKIAFYSGRKGKGQGRIYLVNPDGSNLHELDYPKTGGHDAEPQWSPDGSQIAFTCQRVVDSIESSAIYLMNTDGTELRLLYDHGNGKGSTHLGSWHPSGKGVYFFYWEQEFEPDIFYINLDQSGLKQLTFDHQSYKPYATESQIWFTSNRSGQPQLYAMTEDGEHIMNLSAISGYDFMFGSLVSDGFYFGQQGETAQSTAMYKMDLQGKRVRKIVEIPSNPVMFFNASADQSYMVYATPGANNFDIHLVNLLSGAVTRLTDD